MNPSPIVGKSEAIKGLHQFIDKASKSNSNVLILGETGVGKELAAKAIHYRSERRGMPFLKINCANLDTHLAESELFGHRRGAFTGALADKIGLIEAANKGSFFFDEVSETDGSLQAKLLSVIEDKEIRRVGDVYTRLIDTRFLFAANRDLYNLTMNGKFRQDLYFRINILAHYIPPLRERREDIPLLIDAFISKESEMRNKTFSIAVEAVAKLINYSFPGNVRELANILKRAIELSPGELIEEHHVFTQHTPLSGRRVKASNYSIRELDEVLCECKGNKTRAAERIGMSRMHFYRLLRSKSSRTGYIL